MPVLTPRHRNNRPHDYAPIAITCEDGDSCVVVCPAHTPDCYAADLAKHRSEASA